MSPALNKDILSKLVENATHLREDSPHTIINYRFLRYLPEDFDIQASLHAAFESSGATLEQEKALHGLTDRLSELHPPTLEHSYRVGLLSYKLAKFAGLDPYIALAAGLVHDCGKVEIPIEILERTTGWSKEDALKMREHAMTGYGMLREAGMPLIADIIVRHHTFQKDPYPEVLPQASGELSEFEVSEYAKIVALADRFDSSHRINEYFGVRDALTGEQIKARMLSENADPLIQSAFDSGTFPVIAHETVTAYRRTAHRN